MYLCPLFAVTNISKSEQIVKQTSKRKKIPLNDRSHDMDISSITKVILKYCQKITKMTHLAVKNDKQFKPKHLLVLFIYVKKSKMPIKSVKMKISKNGSLSYPKDHSFQKLGSQVKRCALQPDYTQTHRHTDRQTDTHESDYCVHPFMVSGVFPSTCHQGSAQYTRHNVIMHVVHLC